MNILIRHIEYLLTIHDCVIIPDFGGFLLNYQEASFISTGEILPPRKNISFNRLLKNNDGLLANSISQEKNISYQEALILIESEVKKLKADLQLGATVTFGNIGTLTSDLECNYVFSPSEIQNYYLEYYGFNKLTLNPLYVSESVENVLEKKEFIRLPKIRFVRHVAAVAALIVGFLLISHPIKMGDIPQNQASMISSQLLTNAIVPKMSFAEDFFKTENEIMALDDHFIDSIADSPIIISENEIIDDVVSNYDNEEIKSEESEIIESLELTHPSVPVKMYYVIVGSFPDENSALKRAKTLSEKGFGDVNILFKDNRYRLYIDRFVEKIDATEKIENLKCSDPVFHDSWMLSHRN